MLELELADVVLLNELLEQPLSSEEAVVLVCHSQGLREREVARRLSTTLAQLRVYRGGVIGKLQARSLPDAVRQARRLLSPSAPDRPRSRLSALAAAHAKPAGG